MRHTNYTVVQFEPTAQVESLLEFNKRKRMFPVLNYWTFLNKVPTKKVGVKHISESRAPAQWQTLFRRSAKKCYWNVTFEKLHAFTNHTGLLLWKLSKRTKEFNWFLSSYFLTCFVSVRHALSYFNWRLLKTGTNNRFKMAQNDNKSVSPYPPEQVYEDGQKPRMFYDWKYKIPFGTVASRGNEAINLADGAAVLALIID